MTIAFLKRDGYRQLDLSVKDEQEADSNKDSEMTAVTDFTDLSHATDLSS